jgi:hypothetical protein
MSNHLIHENSPYLLQHANNPVNWYPWCEEALALARIENKPIFLSIGYAACHWCHVMAHESFEEPATAEIMNDHFINIKVDREERPDLDNIYMQAVIALTGQGGWPMSVFLTPDLQPFYGGTYFPPIRRYSMPSFPEVLVKIAEIWGTEREKIIDSAQRITLHLQQPASFSHGGSPFTNEDLQKATLTLAQSYDWKNGGWGHAPKFPQSMAIEFLLRRAIQGDLTARDVALHNLKSMQRGGMYDVIGGGFSRYSTDDQWIIPHFEKMLYDNSLLALVYLHGYLLSSDPTLRRVCERTLDFISRELCDGNSGFFSSLDADSEGEEGKYYLWSRQEIKLALQERSEMFIKAYNITEKGNFEGMNIPHRTLDDQELTKHLKISSDELATLLAISEDHLLSVRNRRTRPATDNKVITAWNGLALVVFAEAARYLGRVEYLMVARENADFLLTHLIQEGRLYRSWRNGEARHLGYLEDYASLILGLLAIYQSDNQPRWYQAAEWLAKQMLELYYDPLTGFFDTGQDHETLLYRPRDIWDNATPSGSSLATQALLQLSLYSGRGDWRDIAEHSLAEIRSLALQHPTGMANWLIAADLAVSKVKEVAILGELENELTHSLQALLWKQWRPHMVSAISRVPPDKGGPALIFDRPLVNDQTTGFICQNFFCQQPTNNPSEFENLLNQAQD